MKGFFKKLDEEALKKDPELAKKRRAEAEAKEAAFEALLELNDD